MSSNLDLEELWREYKATRSPRLRSQLVEYYLPLAQAIARRAYKRVWTWGLLEFDDLYHWGVIGLVDAVNKYNLRRQVSFKTYAATRIYGAIVDGMREFGDVSRTLWKRDENLYRLSLDQVYYVDPEDSDLTLGEMIEDEKGHLQMRWIEIYGVAQAVRKLPERQREIIILYYDARMRMRQIADLFGVTKSRVSQLHSEALKRLQREFRFKAG